MKKNVSFKTIMDILLQQISICSKNYIIIEYTHSFPDRGALLLKLINFNLNMNK